MSDVQLMLTMTTSIQTVCAVPMCEIVRLERYLGFALVGRAFVVMFDHESFIEALTSPLMRPRFMCISFKSCVNLCVTYAND